jgi:hypothetical protein
MKRAIRRSATTDGLESIEELVESFKGVCDECLQRRGFAGARAKKHIETCVAELGAIWEKSQSKPIPLSLGKASGVEGKKEFTHAGPKFVHDVMRAIDPEVTISEIETALRKVLRKPRVQKSTAP